MKKASIATPFLFLAMVHASAQSAWWSLKGFLDGDPDRTMNVLIERNGARTTVRSSDDGRMVSESVLDGDGNPISYRTFAGDGATSLEAAVDDGRGIMVRSRGREWNMISRNDIVLSDPSNFWVFSLWLSREPGFTERSFSLYQDGENRLVGMRLRNAGLQTIALGGRTLRAVCLEMTLSDPWARMFWPHRYRYWFSAEDGGQPAFPDGEQPCRLILGHGDPHPL